MDTFMLKALPNSHITNVVSTVNMSAIEAWHMDESEEDQKLPHRLNPNQSVSLKQLEEIGVYYWKVRASEIARHVT